MRRGLGVAAWVVVWVGGSAWAASTKPVPPAPSAAPVVPLAPPPQAVIPPPDAAPPHPTTPPPPPTVQGDAPSQTSRLAHGLRVTFGSARSDFNPAADAVLQGLAQAGRADAGVVYQVYAHAAGTEADTSSPRRLSLERGLAVRSVLINAGIASTRIYVHAMGATDSDPAAPPDRVDIAVGTLDTSPPAAAPVTPLRGTAHPP